MYLNQLLEKASLLDSSFDVKDYVSFLADPLIPAMQVVIAHQSFKATEENLARVLEVSDHQIKKGLQILENLEMIYPYQSESDGSKVWLSKARNFKVSDKIMDETLLLFHQETTKEAYKALQIKDGLKRFRSIYFSLTPQELEELKEDMEGFIGKMKNKYGKSQEGARKLFKINLQSYPLSQDIV